MEEKVFIKNRNGLNIAVKLNWSKERKKLVFLEHGLCARKEYPHMLVMEQIFAEYGYNVVNFDATNSINESDCSEHSITFTSHYNDLEDVIKWAETKDFYHKPFALAGHNIGALSCILYANTYNKKVDMLIPLAVPWLDGDYDSKHNSRHSEINSKGYYEQYSRSTGLFFKIYIDYFNDIEKYNFMHHIKNITANTYVVYGLNDTNAHMNCSKELYKALNTKKRLFELENMPHNMANTPETAEMFSKTIREILDIQNELESQTQKNFKEKKDKFR